MTWIDHEVERVITQDRSSGMIHLRFRINGQLRVDENCNLDDAGAYDILPDLPDPIVAEKLCRNDFPSFHDPKPKED